MKWAISFPVPALKPEEETALKEALKSAIVTVLMERVKGQVNVQPKVNDWSDDKTAQ